MKGYTLNDEISTLTTIPEFNLVNLNKLTEDIICDTISTRNLKEDLITYNVGYGTLQIQWNGDDVVFNFSPSTRFTKKIREALKGKSTLQENIEQKINQTLIKTYKDLM